MSDLAILVWTVLSRFGTSGAAETDYVEIASALNLDFLPPGAVEQRLGRPVRALVQQGWLERNRRRNRFVYEAIRPRSCSQDQTALLRPQELVLLHNARQERPVTPAHLVDFARWQLECADRGWTAASPNELSERWHMSPSKLRRRRRDLVEGAAGLLLIQPRGASSAITWIKELADQDAFYRTQLPDTRARALRPAGLAKADERDHEPDEKLGPDFATLSSSPLERSNTAQSTSVDVPEQFLRLHRFLLTASGQDQTLTLGQVDVLVDGELPRSAYTTVAWWTNSPSKPQGRAWRAAGRLVQFDERTRSVNFRAWASTGLSHAELAGRRERRRLNALAALVASDQSTVPPEYLKTHWVYQLHLSSEHRFKVGITKSPGLRLHQLAAGRPSVVVDLAEVDNRFLAEIVECDVLGAVRPWQQFGDRDHPAAGFSEMWSDDGPTVALDHVVQAVQQEIRVAVGIRHAEGPR